MLQICYYNWFMLGGFGARNKYWNYLPNSVCISKLILYHHMMNYLGGFVEVEHTTFLSVLGPGSKLNIETLRARLHSLPFKKGFVLLSIGCIHRAQSCQTPLRGSGLEIQKMLYILKNYTTRCMTCFHIGWCKSY